MYIYMITYNIKNSINIRTASLFDQFLESQDVSSIFFTDSSVLNSLKDALISIDYHTKTRYSGVVLLAFNKELEYREQDEIVRWLSSFNHSLEIRLNSDSKIVYTPIDFTDPDFTKRAVTLEIVGPIVCIDRP